MDEKDREDDIRQTVKNRLNHVQLNYKNQGLDAEKATEKLNKTFSTLSRHRKGSIQKKLDRDQLSRRDFLKLLGLTGVGAIAAGGVVSYLQRELGTQALTGYAASNNVEFNGADVSIEQGDGYEIWVPQGYCQALVPSGATVENVLIDLTQTDTVITFNDTGGDWTLRNIGFKGQNPRKKGPNSFYFQVNFSTDCLLENVYGTGWGTELGGILTSGSGNLTIRNSYWAGFGNNSIYASGGGKNGRHGPVTIESCCSRSSTTGNFRIGTPGSEVRNSVAVINDPDGDRGCYPGSSCNRNARPVTARHFPNQRAVNCSVHVDPDDINPPGDGCYAAWPGGGSDGPGPELELEDCLVNESAAQVTNYTTSNVIGSPDFGPTTDVLQNNGVPTSAEMAAQGKRQIPDMDELSGSPTNPTTYSSSSTDSATSPC